MNFIMWLVVGAIVGKLANLLVGAREGLVLDIIMGIVGAFVAGFVLTPLFGISTINQNNFSLPAQLVAAGGAVVLLAVLTHFRFSSRSCRTNTDKDISEWPTPTSGFYR